MDEVAQMDLVSSGRLEVLCRVILQILVAGNDFATFRADEEVLGVLYLLPLSDEAPLQLLSKPESVRSLTVMLQRGSVEAQLHAITILQRVAGAAAGSRVDVWMRLLGDQDMEFFKSLLELLSDEASTTAGACALDVLVDVLGTSKKSRLKAVELGAARLLVELLPEASRHRCEGMLLVLKFLCECPEGRTAFAEHGLGIAAVSKKVLRVSDLATKLGVKVLCLVCSFLPTEKVLDEMLAFGAVKKLLGIGQGEGAVGRASQREVLRRRRRSQIGGAHLVGNLGHRSYDLFKESDDIVHVGRSLARLLRQSTATAKACTISCICGSMAEENNGGDDDAEVLVGC